MEIGDQSFIRRYLTDDSGKRIHESSVDPNVPVVYFIRQTGKDVLLVNWASHTDTVSGSNFTTVSADYPGVFVSYVESKLDAYVSLHMGASADVNPMSLIAEENNFPGTVAYGERLAKTVLDQLPALEPVTLSSSVAIKSSTVRLEIEHSTDDLYEKATEIHSLYYFSGNMTEYEKKCAEYGIV